MSRSACSDEPARHFARHCFTANTFAASCERSTLRWPIGHWIRILRPTMPCWRPWDAEGAVDALLARQGLFRTVRLRVPHFLAAGHLAESTDLIVTAPGRLAEDLARRHDLTAVDPPFDIPGYELTMQWHRRHDGDVAHEWLRGRIEAATR